jgi:glycosyltransferase involved in cell wall biosynthesis
LRVLIVVPSITSEGGGVAEVVRQLMRSLDTHSVEFSVVAMDSATGAVPLVVPSHGTVLCRTWGPRRYGFSPGMLRAICAADADVVHVHGLWMFHCLATLLWHLRTSRPYIITPHGMYERWIRARSRFVKWIVTHAYQAWFIRHASAVHCLTAAEAEDFKAVALGELAVIPNSVPARPDRGSVGRPSWWLPDFGAKTVFLFFGRIHWKKGWMELLEAWRVASSDPAFKLGCQLILAGWIDGEPGFVAAVDAAKAELGNISYVGPQFGSSKDQTMAAAQFMVLPSKSEGLPMVILESWALGVPAIMTDECNLPEGFRQGAALRTTGDAAGIAQALREGWQLSQHQRTDMSGRALDLVEREFSPQHTAGQMAQLYRRQLKGDRAEDINPP